MKKMNKKGYLLLVEDEILVQESNRRILERRGYSIRQAYSLTEAWALIKEQMPLAIVLDIQLPDGNGLDFLKEFRQTSNIPVLMLTAMGTPDDVVKGLEAGGDDYLSKPHELNVFLTRIDALLRRASIVPEKITHGSIIIDTASNKAYINNKDLCLQQKELLLLSLFVQNPEKIISSDVLYEKVWGQKMYSDDGSLKNTAYKLRKKLEDSGYTITAARNEGYILEHE
jgi:DNA-binding response OmpR family regulator